MRFISLFGAFAAAAAVSATTNSTEIQTIAQDMKSGDFVGAAIEILSLGDCDLINLAGCAATFAPLIVDCAAVVATGGQNVTNDLKCFADALAALGSAGAGKCEACIEEGIAIAQSLV
ncbi:hypothetical protein OIDMADRAFT_149358 [Oidiodendron maius Zn]|uniref:Fungal calcium binding protein domain-containing protein n=1 Tax=Oidiodendron maius (strain Zn) TaxID=913774 RepID=A0A0C3C779_OIDMZ|nr:hypothetical protein OIDMADRAFT_149358 [Oidiodendron maius Zn]